MTERSDLAPAVTEDQFADELRAAVGEIPENDDAIFDFIWDLLARQVRIPDAAESRA